MTLDIEPTLAGKPSWWLPDDDSRVDAWASRTYFSLAYADQAAPEFRVNADDPDHPDWFTSGAATRPEARRVQQQACTAIGP